MEDYSGCGMVSSVQENGTVKIHSLKYKTYDSKGNVVIVRYNYDQLEKALEAKING